MRIMDWSSDVCSSDLGDWNGDQLIYGDSGMLKKNVLLAVALSALVAAAPMSALAKKENSGVGPGMNEAGEVVNSAQVESGWGEEVVGINDYEGEITGIAGPDSKFTALKIGMPKNPKSTRLNSSHK